MKYANEKEDFPNFCLASKLGVDCARPIRHDPNRPLLNCLGEVLKNVGTEDRAEAFEQRVSQGILEGKP